MLNADLARIFGGEADAIHLAPYGTELPEDLDSPLDPAFEDVGWMGDEGITESLTGTVEKKRGHQGKGVVRTRINEPGTTVSFVALETKAQTTGLRYHEKQVTTTTGGARKVTRGSGQRISVRAAVIDLYDADDETVKERYCIERLEISPNGDRVAAGDIAALPFLGEIIGDYVHLATDVEAGVQP